MVFIHRIPFPKYSQDKTHKSKISIQLVLLGKGNAPYKIARVIAKLLTSLLGTISLSHMKNFNQLIDKIRDEY